MKRVISLWLAICTLLWLGLLCLPLLAAKLPDGGDDDDDDDSGPPVMSPVIIFPGELANSLEDWQCCRIWMEQPWRRESGTKREAPYVLRPAPSGSIEIVRQECTVSPPAPVQSAIKSLSRNQVNGDTSQPTVSYLRFGEGFVVVIDRGAHGSKAYWLENREGTIPLPLDFPSSFVNCFALVKELLFLGGGSRLDDPFSGMRGYIATFKLEDGRCMRQRCQETEQPVLKMAKGDGNRLFLLCRSIILSCSMDLRTEAVYGRIGYGYLPLLNAGEPGRATWRRFGEEVSFSLLGRSFFVGTEFGLVTITPCGNVQTTEYLESWLVPADVYADLRHKKRGATALPFRFEGESVERSLLRRFRGGD